MKTTLAYILLVLSVLLLMIQLNGKIPLSFNLSYYLVVGISAFVIPLLMQAFLFTGLVLLPSENGPKKAGKIIFILFSIGYLFLSFMNFKYHEYSYAKLFFLQFLIAVLFSIYCVSLALNIKNTVGLILRIFSVVVFIYAVLHFCTKIIGIAHVTNFQISFFIILCIIIVILSILAEKLYPIAAELKRKFYLSMLAFAVVLFVWAKDITYQSDFDFRGQELSYSHALFNNSFIRFFSSGFSSISGNESRKKIAIDSYMNSQCEDYTAVTNQNAAKLIVAVVKNDFNYFELYKDATKLDSITIDKVVENRNSIFNIMPYGDCGNE
jgi:hypothetical protein